MRFFFLTSTSLSCGEEVIPAISLSDSAGVCMHVCVHIYLNSLVLNLCPGWRGVTCFRHSGVVLRSLSITHYSKLRAAGHLPKVAHLVRGLEFTKPRAVWPSIQPSGYH